MQLLNNKKNSIITLLLITSIFASTVFILTNDKEINPKEDSNQDNLKYISNTQIQPCSAATSIVGFGSLFFPKTISTTWELYLGNYYYAFAERDFNVTFTITSGSENQVNFHFDIDLELGDLYANQWQYIIRISNSTNSTTFSGDTFDTQGDLSINEDQVIKIYISGEYTYQKCVSNDGTYCTGTEETIVNFTTNRVYVFEVPPKPTITSLNQKDSPNGEQRLEILVSPGTSNTLPGSGENISLLILKYSTDHLTYETIEFDKNNLALMWNDTSKNYNITELMGTNLGYQLPKNDIWIKIQFGIGDEPNLGPESDEQQHIYQVMTPPVGPVISFELDPQYNMTGFYIIYFTPIEGAERYYIFKSNSEITEINDYEDNWRTILPDNNNFTEYVSGDPAYFIMVAKLGNNFYSEMSNCIRIGEEKSGGLLGLSIPGYSLFLLTMSFAFVSIILIQRTKQSEKFK